jgi:RNA polymerase sigma factor (sigma-70 family)
MLADLRTALIGSVQRRTRNHEDAEDIVQTVLVRLVGPGPGTHPPTTEGLRKLAFTAVHREFIDRWRHVKVERAHAERELRGNGSVEPTLPPPDRTVLLRGSWSDMEARLEAVLTDQKVPPEVWARLSKKERKLLIDRWWRDRTISELAADADRSRTSVANEQTSLKKKLTAHLPSPRSAV